MKTPTSEVTGQMLVDEIAAYEAMGVPDAAVHHVWFLTGRSAHHDPLPVIPDAPRVRPFQLDQLRVCLLRFARLVG